MIGQSSPSLMMRLASMLVRERFNTTSLFFAPIFYGLTNKGWDMRPTKTSQQISSSFLSLFPRYILPVTTSTLNIENHQQEQEQHIWFAVPKSKISRSRKRMKNTRQKRIPLKKNIVFDPRTGEISLRHKLPFNWKDYLPKTV